MQKLVKPIITLEMEEENQNNLIYRTDHLGDLPQVLNYFLQHDVISKNEKEIIEAETASSGKKSELLSAIERNDSDRDKNLLEIPEKTNNEHCVDKIQGIITTSQSRNTSHQNIKSKWWPDEKLLIKSLHKRKFGSKLLVEELHERILKDDNRMVVLCESADAAKYSGMGGVGKTLTAKWYAHHYKEEYDHILWIDCGEDSLKKSFEKLARDLDVRNRSDLNDADEFAQKTFLALTGFKCLWIYDNAESFQGEEGILKILPKAKENFFCLITSRSRECEWGVTNVGHGKISELKLEIFSEEESLQFLKANLEVKTKQIENELTELCRLMGNLPMALQLAIAALNTRKIDVKKYIKKTSAEDSAVILEAKFNDYEKIINKNIKISLDLISKDKRNGKLAFDILMVFGYIRPNKVQSNLFMRIFKSKLEDVKKAVDILEKYSLVSRTDKRMEFPYDEGIFNKIFGWPKLEVEIDVLDIHRLLQQVIRHNGNHKERKTLKKIFGCEGFIDFKLIPYTKYADQKLQKEFPKVKAELLDKIQLRKLMREKRLDECVQLAKLIDQEVKTKTSLLNYCVCLEKNGQLEECGNTLEELFVGTEKRIELGQLAELFKRWSFKFHVDKEWTLFDLDGEVPTKTEVADFLFDIYMRLQKYEQAVEIINQTESTEKIQLILSKLVDDKRYEEAVELANYIHQQFNTKTTGFNYAICLERSGQTEECLEMLEKLFVRLKDSPQEFTGFVEEVFQHSHEMTVKTVSTYPKMYLTGEASDADVGSLVLYCHLCLGNYQRALDVAKQTVTNVESLIQLLSLTQIPNYHLEVDGYKVDLILDVKTKIIRLNNCSLSLDSFDELSSEKLTLFCVSFFRNEQELKEVKVNDFLDFSSMKKLTLSCDYDKKNMSVDLSGDVSVDYLWLNKLQVLNWSISNWNVKELELWSVPLVEKTNMNKVEEMTFMFSSLDISCLPPTISKITLGGRIEISESGKVKLPNLSHLKLTSTDVNYLSNFHSAPLTHIHLHAIEGEVNVDLLPPTLTHLQITKSFYCDTRVVGGVRKVDNLRLNYFCFEIVEECLRCLHTHNLLIDNYDYVTYGIEVKDLVELISKQIKTIAVGALKWESGKDDFEDYSTQLNRQADYYLVEGRKGRGIERQGFQELSKLF